MSELEDPPDLGVDRPEESLQLGDLPTPALVLDLDILERNLRVMEGRCRRLGVALRPHFKTHKSLQIAARQADLGARGLTVATLREARTLLEAGFRDLTWAFPLILNSLPELFDLLRAHPGAHLGLVADSYDAITSIETELVTRLRSAGDTRTIPVWLKVDGGYHRAGVDPESDFAVELARRLHESEPIRFQGLLSHSGQAYRTPGQPALAAAAEEERSAMVGLAERLRSAGIAVPEVSVGSTPGMAGAGHLDGVTEARPGNYVFHDYAQVLIGSCTVRDCAVSVMSSVVSTQPGAEHCVVDAGALTLSKDPGVAWADPPTYGEIFGDYAAGVLNPDIRLTSLSQEHGIVNAPLPVGTRLRILPNHSCLAVPCFSAYAAVRGDAVVGYIDIDHRPIGTHPRS